MTALLHGPSLRKSGGSGGEGGFSWSRVEGQRGEDNEWNGKSARRLPLEARMATALLSRRRRRRALLCSRSRAESLHSVSSSSTPPASRSISQCSSLSHLELAAATDRRTANQYAPVTAARQRRVSTSLLCSSLCLHLHLHCCSLLLSPLLFGLPLFHSPRSPLSVAHFMPCPSSVFPFLFLPLFTIDAGRRGASSDAGRDCASLHSSLAI